jgi:hypothetical protein
MTGNFVGSYELPECINQTHHPSVLRLPAVPLGKPTVRSAN